MTSNRGIVAQISTYPPDAGHAQWLLPHQVRAWGSMVDRIVVTIDTHQSSAGRYRDNRFQENLARLRRSINEVRKTHPHVHSVDVDYSPSTHRAVSRFFFGVESIPCKAWDGGPFYAYFFGLWVSRARYVAHFDGDMMFGGGGTSWVRDAVACMERDPQILMTAPSSGPPRPDGAIFGHPGRPEFMPSRGDVPYVAHRHSHVSTRIFMIDLERFKRGAGVFRILRPSRAQRVKAALLGNPPDAREAEVVMSESMRSSGLVRVDLPGCAPGMWSLHPPYRTEEFYRRLPDLVRAVEAGRVPDSQRGHYDLQDSMIDWTQARVENRWHRRYLRMLRQRLHESA